MKKIILIIILLIVSNSLANAIEMDLVQYKYKEGRTLLELNYQMQAAKLLYIKDSSGAYVSNLEYNFVVSSAGVDNINNSWIYSYTKSSNDSTLTIFDKKYFSLYPGQYNVKFSTKIAGNKFSDIEGTILIRDFSKNQVTISDILLAHQLDDYDSLSNNELFRKHKLYVIPNVEHTISGLYPYLKYYYEVYNIDTTKSNSIEIDLEITTGDNRPVFKSKKNKTIFSSSIYDYGMIPVDTLDNGVYKLEISIYQKKKMITQQHVKFFVLDPNRDFHISNKYVENLTFEQSPFAIMTEEKINYEFETMKAILSEFDIEKYNSLNTLRSRQRALFTYWKERDPDTTTAVNEYMNEYQKRIDYASKFFSRGDIMPGWKTERGRVLLKYGFPSNKEVYRAQGDKKAAEDWQYDELYGGCYFIFVDKYGDNSFQLVHSSAPKEIKNYNWYKEFNPAIDNDGSPKYNNSRNDDK